MRTTLSLLILVTTIFCCGNKARGQQLLPAILDTTEVSLSTDENHPNQVFASALVPNPDDLYIRMNIHYSADSNTVANGLGDDVFLSVMPQGEMSFNCGDWTDPLALGATYYFRLQVWAFESIGDMLQYDMGNNSALVYHGHTPITPYEHNISMGVAYADPATPSNFLFPVEGNSFLVESVAPETLEVMDLSGKLVYTTNLTPGRTTVHLPGSGMLIARATSDNRTQKIFVQ